ncbi:methyltransferase domain-containing protein [Candidatus Woesearchaeota archaeon]|nr:methyltransferase domain-containing protein [Candidatus Woesearchaeota archaeon]
MYLDLLDYLVCPKCKAEFILKDYKGVDNINTGELVCSECKKSYKIINGIPRILDNINKEKKITAKRFAYEWYKFNSMYKEAEHQFLDWVWPVKKEFFLNKIILDAGCGMGRHAYLSSKFGAKLVIGIDLGDSVNIAYKNTKALKNIHIIQADIYNLPFKKESFDYIYSIGVLHHLPNPKDGFNKLLIYLKKNSLISIWVYGKENNPLLPFLNLFRKTITRNLSLSIVYFLSYFITIIFWPIINFIFFTKTKISFYDFFYYLKKLGFYRTNSIIFDQLLAPTAFYYTKKEISSWFINLHDVKISWRNKNSWRGTAKKI